jgi:hypothetical protein
VGAAEILRALHPLCTYNSAAPEEEAMKEIRRKDMDSGNQVTI